MNERLDSYNNEINRIIQNPKIQQLPKEKLDRFETILKNAFFDHLLNLKGTDTRAYFDNYGYIFPQIFHDFSAWYDFTIQALKHPTDAHQKIMVFKKMLENGFGRPMIIAHYMDGILDGMEVIDHENAALKMENAEDYVKKGNNQKIKQTMLHKWLSLDGF